MYLTHLKIRNHPILKNLELDLINPNTKKPYNVVAFVGENGCGKTTLLNEIFNYEKSQYIVDKVATGKVFDALYLRQGSLHRNAMKELRKLIDGKDIYPINSANNGGPSNSLTDTRKGVELLETIGDEEITKIFKENHIGEVYCSSDVSKKIDGKDHGYDITNYSSGQQEILLKLKDIKNMAVGTDCVLLDEPETSLHPRWQKEIVHLIELMVNNDAETPQIFLATHSEKVLESLISREDVLIVRLSKDDDGINTETISEMDLRLPSVTFAELDYIVFHIESLEYHDELFNYFLYQIGKNSTFAGDEKIEKFGRKLLKNDYEQIVKTRVFKVHGVPAVTNTLPTYIRDFFHHPNELKRPTSSELSLSIKFMRALVQYMDKRLNNNQE